MNEFDTMHAGDKVLEALYKQSAQSGEPIVFEIDVTNLTGGDVNVEADGSKRTITITGNRY